MLNALKPFSLVIKVGGALLIAASAALLALGLLTGATDTMEEMSKTLGAIAEYGAIGAGALWLVRHAVGFVKKRKMSFGHYVQMLFKLLRTYHTFIGWVVFSVATSHGVYFLLNESEHMDRVYSGLATFIGLVVLVSFGLLLQKRGKNKKYAAYKRVHQLIALLFGLALLIHLVI
ncbi:hypothetical protein LC040_03815 [Bacillus tianshenii]|nr:hypothetical protein LC040_03815 [Bacillus tianshenii]